MPGRWKTSSTPVLFNAGTILLLTDGCVLAQHDGTQQWWKLAPDRQGHYVGGTWKRVARSASAPRLFPAAVLPDGRVFIAGGAFSNGQAGNLGTVELYDPQQDSWTSLQPPAGWQTIGNAPICLLADGKLLLGSVNNPSCMLFDPANLSWTATAGAKQNANSAGETWTLLPGGNVLSVDCDGRGLAQRYDNGNWIDVPTPGAPLVADGRVGPALLLSNGTVLVLSAISASRRFSGPGRWEDGPPLQTAAGAALSGRAGAACLLPTGNVLCALATPAGATVFVEFDGTAFQPTSQPQAAFGALDRRHLLLLPDGMVMYTDGTRTVRFYEPEAPANAVAGPFLSDWPADIRPGETGTLQGAQLTGLSQACASGAQAGPATNYPLVRLQAAQPSGLVTYCRTINPTPGGVATGSASQSASFIVPPNLAAGAYRLTVIANGIASLEQSLTVTLAKTPDQEAVDPEQLDMQREMFRRELNEVHLLMDFISGRADKSLAELRDVPDPDRPGEMLKPDEAVRRVCEIRFPPTGTDESKARQAALLLSVKDKLNALADPARGLSVAFTSMFSGVANRRIDQGSGLLRKMGGPFGLNYNVTPGKQGSEGRRQDIYGFANAAYPNLIGKAAVFRFWFGILPWLVLIWALFTALVSWDVYTSSAALATVTGLEDQEAHLVQPGHTYFPTPADCDTGTGIPINYTGDDKDAPAVCRHFADLEALLRTARPELAAFTELHLKRHPVGWLIFIFSPEDNAPGSTDKPREQLAGSAISIFTGYIVPMMFGMLGTLASVVRSVWAKVRDATLRPEDAKRAFNGVPLGLVAGLSVGLIITPTGNAVQGVTNIAGSITLSATALAFLAGYGAEAFFGMIDELLKRVFNLGDAGSAK
jgi:hypothetical protein